MIKSFNLLLFNVYLFLSFNICSKTIVYTNPYGGLGDIFSAVKTATFLKENNLNIALYVDLSSDSNKYLQNSDVIKNVKNIAMNKDIIFINSHQEAFEYEPDNFILVTGKSPPAELINDLSMKKAYIIYEYNEKSVLTPEIFSKKNIPVIEVESGFQKNGVFVLEESEIKNIKPIKTWVEENSESRLSELTQRTKEHLSLGNYFFGYASGYNHGFDINAYITMVALFAKQKNIKNLVFFLAGDMNNNFGSPPNIVRFFANSGFELKNELNSNAIYSISGQKTHKDNNDEEQAFMTGKKVYNKPEGFNLTIIRGRIDNDDFLTLLNGSKYPFALVTGDQSLSEALGLGKIPIYQALSHKNNVIPSLTKTIEEKNSDLASIIDNLTLKTIYRNNLTEFLKYRNNMVDSLEQLTNNYEKENYKAIILEVLKENNLLENLLKMIE